MPTASQRDLFGQTLSGRYRIKGILGEGGMGTVYDAEHLGLARQVAIKVLSPSQAKKRTAVKRFQQEARAAGAIGHPNICEVYDLGVLDDGSPYLVMEKLIGQTLAERIGKEGGLPFEDVIEVVVQVLSGLVAAHEKGIIHRDIKPENIFLARRVGCPPIVKILDFGVSKMMPEFANGEDVLDLTRTGMVMGTPYYMSPEQARGERNLDGRVDVYATGVVMYEAIAGKRPFLASNYNALLLAIINTSARSLRDVRPKTPPELDAIVMRAMAKNRAERFPTAKHFLRDLAPPTPMVPAAAPSAARVPARTPALGVRAGSDPHQRQASSTLQSRMNDKRDRDSATRIEVPRGRTSQPRELGREVPRDRESKSGSGGVRVGSGGFGRAKTESAPKFISSVDIPIHVEMEDDTEIFHPTKHAPPRRDSQPKQMPEPEAEASFDDDATVVRHPKAPLPPPSLPPQVELNGNGRSRARKVFDADDTMRLDRDEVELIDERTRRPR